MASPLRRLALARSEIVLGDLLERLAEHDGDRRLVDQEDGPTLTYAQAALRVRLWAGGIAERVRPGDRVVIATRNGYEMLLLCLAASRAGAVAVPVNPELAPEEVDHVIADSAAALVVRDPAEVEGASPCRTGAAADPRDTAALFYTSGTTGRAKGVALSHRAIAGALVRTALAPRFVTGRLEAVVALPVAHIMGFIVLVGFACAGIPVHVLRRFHPVKVLDAIERRRASIYVGVPAMYRMLLEAGAEQRDLTCVRFWGSGADAMPAELAARFKKLGAAAHLPGIGPVGEATFVEGYGMVELAGAAAIKVSPPALRLGLGTSAFAFPVPGFRFRVVDPDTGEVLDRGRSGELQVTGPGVTSGYHGDAEATASAMTGDGWLRTGDLGRLGPLGTITVEGRAKDVVKVGGYSVYAPEVERVLELHADVLEAAVVPVPDERKGEVPGAVLRLRPGAELDEAALTAFCAEHLADYKVPRRWAVVDELPRTATNKVRKRDLVARFQPG